MSVSQGSIYLNIKFLDCARIRIHCTTPIGTTSTKPNNIYPIRYNSSERSSLISLPTHIQWRSKWTNFSCSSCSTSYESNWPRYEKQWNPGFEDSKCQTDINDEDRRSFNILYADRSIKRYKSQKDHLAVYCSTIKYHTYKQRPANTTTSYKSRLVRLSILPSPFSEVNDE